MGKRVKAATAKGGGGWTKDVTVKLAQTGKPGATAGAAPGVVIMTSSNGQQASLEMAALKNSLFTYHLMNTLMKPAQADTNGDGRMTMAELYQAVYQRVTADAEQQPQISDERAAQNVVVLAYQNGGDKPTPKPTPASSQEGKPTLLPSSEGPGWVTNRPPGPWNMIRRRT